MQNILYSNILTILIVFSSIFQLAAQKENKYVYTNVNVIDVVNQKIVENQHVFINGNRIEKISPANKKKIKNYTIIKSKGKFIMPGMMDAHAHLPGKQGLEMPVEDYLLMQLANGVTDLRCLRHEPDHLDWKKKASEGEITSPLLYISSPMVSVYSEMDYTKADELFQSYKDAGYDHIKYMNGLNKATHKSLCSIAEEVGIPFVGHLPRYISLEDAINNGQDGIEHFNGYMNYGDDEIEELKSLIELSAAKQLYNCPTIDWYEIVEHYIDNPKEVLNNRRGLEYLPEELVKDWNAYLDKLVDTKESKSSSINPRIKILDLFKEAEVPLLVSPGDGAYIIPGFGMLEEMKLYKKGGLNNWEILRAATINGHLFYNEKNVGEIKENHLANLVILNKNPIDKIENITSIEGVMVNGKWHTQKELESALNHLKG